MVSDNSRRDQASGRFRKGLAGNLPGRPAQTRRSVTQAEVEADALVREIAQQATAGDVTALRRCLERIVPPRDARAAAFELVTVMRLIASGSIKLSLIFEEPDS